MLRGYHSRARMDPRISMTKRRWDAVRTLQMWWLYTTHKSTRYHGGRGIVAPGRNELKREWRGMLLLLLLLVLVPVTPHCRLSIQMRWAYAMLIFRFTGVNVLSNAQEICREYQGVCLRLSLVVLSDFPQIYCWRLHTCTCSQLAIILFTGLNFMFVYSFKFFGQEILKKYLNMSGKNIQIF